MEYRGVVDGEDRREVTHLTNPLSDDVNEVGRVLFHGFGSGAPLARGDWGFHALQVYALLRGGHDGNRVALHLGEVRTAELRMPADPESDQEMARQLVRWWGGRGPSASS